jgi:hypothetical protein
MKKILFPAISGIALIILTPCARAGAGGVLPYGLLCEM